MHRRRGRARQRREVALLVREHRSAAKRGGRRAPADAAWHRRARTARLISISSRSHLELIASSSRAPLDVISAHLSSPRLRPTSAKAKLDLLSISSRSPLDLLPISSRSRSRPIWHPPASEPADPAAGEPGAACATSTRRLAGSAAPSSTRRSHGAPSSSRQSTYLRKGCGDMRRDAAREWPRSQTRHGPPGRRRGGDAPPFGGEEGVDDGVCGEKARL